MPPARSFGRTNLAAVMQMWTGIPAAQDKPGNWELKKHSPPNLIRFVRAGDWVVFGGGQDALPLSDELVRRILAEKRPAPAEKNDWLTADLDWPRLARGFRSLNPLICLKRNCNSPGWTAICA